MDLIQEDKVQRVVPKEIIGEELTEIHLIV